MYCRRLSVTVSPVGFARPELFVHKICRSCGKSLNKMWVYAQHSAESRMVCLHNVAYADPNVASPDPTF